MDGYGRFPDYEAATAAASVEKICTKCRISKPANRKFFLAKKNCRFGLDPQCKSCQAAAKRLYYADPIKRAKRLATNKARLEDPIKRAKENRRKRVWAQASLADPIKRAAANASAKKSSAKNRAKINEAQRAKRSEPENRAKAIAYMQAWNSDPLNKAKQAAARKARREDPILGAADKATRESNRARKAALDKALRENPEWKSRKVAYQREWDAKPENRRRRNQSLVAKRKENAHLRVQQNTRTVVRSMIKQGSKGCLRHLPYTIPELCVHLEKQFVRGMTWENYGPVWHLDHILPIATFNINAANPANCPEFQACWALSNLRPLWKLANLSKSFVRTHLI